MTFSWLTSHLIAGNFLVIAAAETSEIPNSRNCVLSASWHFWEPASWGPGLYHNQAVCNSAWVWYDLGLGKFIMQAKHKKDAFSNRSKHSYEIIESFFQLII